MKFTEINPWAFWIGWLFIGIGFCQFNGWVGIGLMIISASIYKSLCKQQLQKNLIDDAERAGINFAKHVERTFGELFPEVLTFLFDLGKNDEAVFFQIIKFINDQYDQSDKKGVAAVCLAVLKYADRIDEGALGEYHINIFERNADLVNDLIEIMKGLENKAS